LEVVVIEKKSNANDFQNAIFRYPKYLVSFFVLKFLVLFQVHGFCLACHVLIATFLLLRDRQSVPQYYWLNCKWQSKC